MDLGLYAALVTFTHATGGGTVSSAAAEVDRVIESRGEPRDAADVVDLMLHLEAGADVGVQVGG